MHLASSQDKGAEFFERQNIAKGKAPEIIRGGRRQKAEGMHIDGSRFQYVARVKSRLGDCYKEHRK